MTREGEIIINELAPRPHNSGHTTLEDDITQNHVWLAAASGLALPSPKVQERIFMTNMLTEGELVQAISGVTWDDPRKLR